MKVILARVKVKYHGSLTFAFVAEAYTTFEKQCSGRVEVQEERTERSPGALMECKKLYVPQEDLKYIIWG